MPQVSEAEATAWIATECQVTTQPCLDAVEIAHLVRAAQRPDADGYLPSEAAWTPTYDLAWAAWKGWVLKAGKAALFVDVSQGQGGMSVSKSQVRQACLEMANLYARGVLQAAVISTGATGGDAGFTLATPGTTPGEGIEVLPDADSLEVGSDA